jgi:hypothetical protein
VFFLNSVGKTADNGQGVAEFMGNSVGNPAQGGKFFAFKKLKLLIADT